MSHKYRVFVHAESLGILPRSGKRREAVFSFFEYLELNHGEEGDVSFIDPESRRTYFVSTVSGYTITWWVDSPVKEIKVVKIS